MPMAWSACPRTRTRYVAARRTRTRSEYFEAVDVAATSVVLRIVTKPPAPILRCT